MKSAEEGSALIKRRVSYSLAEMEILSVRYTSKMKNKNVVRKYLEFEVLVKNCNRNMKYEDNFGYNFRDIFVLISRYVRFWWAANIRKIKSGAFDENIPLSPVTLENLLIMLYLMHCLKMIEQMTIVYLIRVPFNIFDMKEYKRDGYINYLIVVDCMEILTTDSI